MNYNLFTVSTLILAVTSLILSLIVFLSGKSKLHQMWGVYNLAVAFWGGAGFLAGISQEAEKALFWWRVAHFGIALIPVLLFHATLLFCSVKRKFLLSFVYVQGVFFMFFIPYNAFFKGVEFLFSQFYYPILGPIYHLFFTLWILIVFVAQCELFVLYRNTSGVRKVQVTYLFVALIVGFLGGITNFLPGYISSVYPFGNVFIPIYSGIVTYAILKYRLLDISLVITRTGIFIAVYSIVLGIPFALAFGLQEKLVDLFDQNWWVVPLVISTILATVGPFLYLYIQGKAEDRLLQEQRQYQLTLRRASMGMGQIKDLKRLLRLIVHIVTKAVSIEHCEIFLLHEESKQFILKASRGMSSDDKGVSMLTLDSPLVNHLKRIKEPIIYEEIKQRIQDYGDVELKKVEADISKIGGTLVVPSFMDQKLIAMLVLGKKKSGKLYTQDDLAVFSILANQAGLAIENAQFYERMKETHKQLVKAEKMATVGTMADGLSHQINNRLHAMGFIAGDALDTIKLKKKTNLSQDMHELLDEIEHSLGRIEDNVKRGGEIVEGLLKYTRKGSEGFGPINLNKLLDAALEMAQFKIKLDEMDFVRSFDDGIPDIKGNFTQLQEVFFNIIDNAYDAMMQRKAELKEPGYRANLKISANQKDHKLEILIQDNGIGVKEENLEKLFTPFFTTKLSSKKGTGLGLYVIRQIVEENHGGKVKFISKYKKGSQTQILLPIAVG